MPVYAKHFENEFALRFVCRQTISFCLKKPTNRSKGYIQSIKKTKPEMLYIFFFLQSASSYYFAILHH